MKSRQRLGDDPRDHDGEFGGVDEEHADVCGQRPDIDHTTNQPLAEQPFQPWKIYPKPPPPHWHWKSKEVLSHDETEGDGFQFEACDIPAEVHPWTYEIDSKGVYQVYETSEDGKGELTILLHYWNKVTRLQ